jgi:hypothetical protein
MSKLISLETPIRASWVRSLELVSLQYATNAITLVVDNDDDGKRWRIGFSSTQALRVTAFECALMIMAASQGQDATFEVVESQWIEELGKGSVRFLEASRHFVICCYDEVIEVVAHRFDSSEASKGI